MPDRLLAYYNQELEGMQRLASEFAAAHPKIAGRLRLSADAIDDPHAGRLIEAFSFIAGRLRLKLDDDFPELTETLLDFLYPHYLAPIPSAAICQFEPTADFAEELTVPRGTLVESEPIGGDVCRFRTTQAVELWPVAVRSAALSGRPLLAPPAPRFDAAASLRVVLHCLDPEMTFTRLGVDRLRFFLRAPWRQAVALYELLLNRTIAIALADHAEDQAATFLGADAIKGVGFGLDEALIPPSPRSFPGYRLLTEFFACPQKFLFVELSGISAKALRHAGNTLEVFFYLRHQAPEIERAVTRETFAIGCTPIVNLFSQHAEPIELTHELSEYPLVPDARRHGTREIYSVDRVVVTERTGHQRVATPFFARGAEPGGDALHWQLRRRRIQAGDDSTDATIALFDSAFQPVATADRVISVETTCLNRDLPAQLPYGGPHPVLRAIEGAAAITPVRALTPLTPTLRLASGEALLWRLLSHLSLNHISLVDSAAGADALREMLRLYDYRDTPETRALINAIATIGHRRTTARVPGGGLARGIDVDLEINPRHTDAGTAYLFGAVLERFLSLYANLNSFTRLALRLTAASEPLKIWPARTGARPLV
jgi:type VI secretion system protein ImpG